MRLLKQRLSAEAAAKSRQIGSGDCDAARTSAVQWLSAISTEFA
jgi:hypothetical protein